MEKINIAELLKDCPKGMELDCTMFENVTFEEVVTETDCDGNEDISIILLTHYNDGMVDEIILTEYGTYTYDETAKCVIFPKGKTTWKGFQRAFKGGDVVIAGDNESFQLFLLKRLTHTENSNKYYGDCYFGWNFQDNELFEKGNWTFHRLATEEEKEKLFQAIKDNGYKWNAETKTLEKLTKFKVGDRIKHIVGREEIATVVSVEKLHYNLDSKVGTSSFSISLQHEWELIPNKFDINTFKPFDKVLVRTDDKHVWSIQFFERLNNILKDSFVCMGGVRYRQCIPYKGNEHLLNTANDCDKFYKTWEES